MEIRLRFVAIRKLSGQEHIAKILRTTPKVILDMEEKMEQITGRKDVVEKIINENEKRIKMAFQIFNLANHDAEQLYEAIINKLKRNDEALHNLFRKPDGLAKGGLRTLFNFALELANIKPLYVLKKEIAQKILENNPPPNILKALKYKNVKELFKKEDLFQVFSALRFVESNKWMHQVFDKTYKNLGPEDFEERKVKVLVLDGKWLKVAKKFVKKKYHNVSHLKELGVLFIIPLKIDTPGETMRVFSLIIHYLHELDFYCDLFRKSAKEKNLPAARLPARLTARQARQGKAGFGEKISSLLRGDVLEKLPETEKGMNWMIIQRYLAKDDKNDPRLFVPHVNPETIHWKKAERDIANLGKRFKELDLEFWEDLDWVGDFFESKVQSPKSKVNEVLVSFDLIDAVMSLVREEGHIKYLYHQQEALWNKIFEEYVGEKSLEKLVIDNFDKGYISLY